MTVSRTIGRSAIAASVIAMAIALPVAPASAQDGLSWIWGGGSVVGGSGRQVVSFSNKYNPGQIIVSFGDRKLYWVHRRGEAISYPIAIPRDQSRWAGTMSVSMKRVNPPWTPTPTMRRENPKLPAYVPGGHPLNPMGVRALYLGSSAYRIHGTDAPWTIGQAVSKGCIRMYNQDVVDLYPRVPVGTRVTVTWNKYQTGYASAASSDSSSGGSWSFWGNNDDQPTAAERRREARKRYLQKRRAQRAARRSTEQARRKTVKHTQSASVD